jgi:hypothetical protein
MTTFQIISKILVEYGLFWVFWVIMGFFFGPAVTFQKTKNEILFMGAGLSELSYVNDILGYAHLLQKLATRYEGLKLKSTRRHDRPKLLFYYSLLLSRVNERSMEPDSN